MNTSYTETSDIASA